MTHIESLPVDTKVPETVDMALLPLIAEQPSTPIQLWSGKAVKVVARDIPDEQLQNFRI